MTETNHIEVLRRLRDWAGQKIQVEALDAAITALSARASAGEGGEKRFIYTYRCTACRFEADMCDSAKIALVKCPCGGTMQRKDDDPIASFTAAPQPAQAGASGGGEPVGEFQDWFEAWAKEKEEIILHRIADGRLMSPTASITESAFLAGCMTASMYYMELCRNDSAAATPPAHGDGEGDSRESRMVVIRRDASGKPAVWCDPEIADLVSALNAGGIPTAASCSGHGERHGNIALADGRELLIAPDYDTARAMDATLLTRPTPETRDTERLDYIERTFSGVTNRERYLPVQMIWGKGCNGRTLREACDKYMKRDAALALPAQGEGKV